jgi:hypothetical protein
MQEVASITKYKSTNDLMEWLDHLPKKYSVEYVEKLIKVARKAKYLLWTEKHGIKLLK